MHPEAPELQTANVVLTVQLRARQYTMDTDASGTSARTSLNLSAISIALGGLEYAPGNFSAGIVRLKYPCCTLLIFESANLVCTGARTENEAILAINVLRNMLTCVGVHTDPVSPRTQNIVSRSHVGCLVDLDALYKDNEIHMPSFTPDLFPGLVVPVVADARWWREQQACHHSVSVWQGCGHGRAFACRGARGVVRVLRKTTQIRPVTGQRYNVQQRAIQVLSHTGRRPERRHDDCHADGTRRRQRRR